MRSALQSLNASWKMVLLRGSRLAPRSKMPHFSIVSVVCEVHFWSDEEDFAIQADHTTVVSDISVLNWHSNIQKDITARFIRQDSFQHFPTSKEQILFAGKQKELVLAISQHSDVVGRNTGGDQDSHIRRFQVQGPREAVPLLLWPDEYFLLCALYFLQSLAPTWSSVNANAAVERDWKYTLVQVAGRNRHKVSHLVGAIRSRNELLRPN